MGDGMSLNPIETAVLLIEFQNDFTTDGGTLHSAVADVMKRTGMLDNAVAAAEQARQAGATIIHAPISFAKGYGEISPKPYGILAGVVASNAFVKDSWGARIVAGLTPAAGDIIVEGKRGLDTFMSTNLDFILRSRGIRNVALGGFLTNCCVESTMRTAYEKGFNVFTLTDCVAATSQEEHDNAIANDFPMFSHPVTSKEFVASLGARGETATDASRGCPT
ncbi:cysteine hydrolase [Frankia sp. Cj5]|uniref:cysteine hydrolase n=1 Tax=Frankia sp. Cj5 TaxID=2880978 RepID=UPI00351CCD0B